MVLWNQANASGTFTFTQDQDLHAGPYEHEWQGATVSLADAPCDFTDPEVPTCPTPKHTCGRVTAPTMCPFADNHYCPSVIDCGGVKAKYVRLQLPGKHRVLDVCRSNVCLKGTLLEAHKCTATHAS